MKLATLKSTHKTIQNRDGDLILVSRDNLSAVLVTHLARNLREALENWGRVGPELEKLSLNLNQKKAEKIFPVQVEHLEACLPRTFLFADGSAFIHHIRLVRKARNAQPPETLMTVPLMYQAEGAKFLAPTADIPQRDFQHGTDLEAEVGVIVDDVPMGVSAEQAIQHIKLICLINDVSLRGLIPNELAQGFGFFVSKPAKALSPFALTPDELGAAWIDGRVKLPLNVEVNQQFFGRANAGEMHFHFGQLIAHAAQTRNLSAGTLIGSGTVSNEDPAKGSSCIVEKRTIEQIESGAAVTPYLKVGDSVKIWMEGPDGSSLFGNITQKVSKHA